MALKYDFTLDISTGKSRKDTSWKNKTLKWSEFIAQCSTTQRTHDTVKEYLASKPDIQADIKDVGGFVGGTIMGGRRKNGKIMSRSMITLDIDFGKLDTWENYEFLFSYAALLYSTHKHTEAKPRYRLIIPLSREARPDEYEATARRFASEFDIELFDRTTFEPTRLMYWPSTSKDGIFEFKYQDGPALDVDAYLAKYKDWRDVSQWPLSDEARKLRTHAADKQADPLSKDGIIGAFCRTYNIHEAIEKFLSDEYEMGDEGRYSYTKGTTSNGLVVYDGGIFAFSHHSTDPARDQLLNAFDLVRIHLFGHEDDGKENTAINKLPSFIAMQEFAGQDGEVRITMARERFESANAAFAEIYPVQHPVSKLDSSTPSVEGLNAPTDAVELGDWVERLDRDRKGNLQQTITNARMILDNDPRLKDCFAIDLFSQRKVILKSLPWRPVTAIDMYITDTDEADLRMYMERVYGFTARNAISDALASHLARRAFHPIKNYLNGLEWDGKPRLDRLLIKYMGAKDCDYTKAVTRKTFTAAVARIYEPGIKFDYVLTIAGYEGRGKSTLIKKMGGEWFSDNFTTIVGKEAKEQIQGVWLIEMGEMSALRKAEVVSIKQFVSSQEDSFRPAYGVNKIYVKRQCIFFATTNEVEFLRGADGNRRFWVIDTHDGEPEADVLAATSVNEAERGQLWAEALHYYKAGEALYLDTDLEAVARTEQRDHGEKDTRSGIVEAYLSVLKPDNWEDMTGYERRAWFNDDPKLRQPGTIEHTKTCTMEIWVEVLEGKPKDLNAHEGKLLGDLLKQLPGWGLCKQSRFKHYGRQTAFTKNDSTGKEVRTGFDLMD